MAPTRSCPHNVDTPDLLLCPYHPYPIAYNASNHPVRALSGTPYRVKRLEGPSSYPAPGGSVKRKVARV